jgi:replication factor C subunit 1
MSKSLAGNMTLRLGPSAKSALERSVIIMDECDGMAGGDVGGMQALMNMIKTTKSPIICICNDRGDQAVRQLSSVCFDIKFKRPDNALVAKRMKNILEGEGKKADLVALEAIVEACGHDMRQTLNQVQFFGVATSHAQGSQKDTQLQSNPFDACTRLLSKQSDRGVPAPMASKLDLFYIDPDMMPLMIQENYMRPYEKMTRSVEAEDMRQCAYAAEMISTADAMRGGGDFSLMSSVAAIGTIYPSFLTGVVGAALRPFFPAWLQKRGTSTKAARLAQEMHSHIRPFTTIGRRELQTSGYLEVLHRRMLKPLNSGDAKACAALLHSYGLTREFFTDQAPALREPLKLDDLYKRADGKARTVLLSELQELQRTAPVKRVGRQGDGGSGKRTLAEDGDEVDEGGVVIKKKQPPKKKARVITEEELSKTSLGGWITKPDNKDADGNEMAPPPKKEAGILLKFIEGHTNAVRRTITFEEIMGPWRQF